MLFPASKIFDLSIGNKDEVVQSSVIFYAFNAQSLFLHRFIQVSIDMRALTGYASERAFLRIQMTGNC